MKYFLAVIILYLLALIQISFLPHFDIWIFNPNILLALVIIWNLFEQRKNSFGLVLAIIAGIYMDLFSSGMFGIQIAIFIVPSLAIKYIFKKHVQIPFSQEF